MKTQVLEVQNPEDRLTVQMVLEVQNQEVRLTVHLVLEVQNLEVSLTVHLVLEVQNPEVHLMVHLVLPAALFLQESLQALVRSIPRKVMVPIPPEGLNLKLRTVHLEARLIPLVGLHSFLPLVFLLIWKFNQFLY